MSIVFFLTFIFFFLKLECIVNSVSRKLDDAVNIKLIFHTEV